jgi:hypothetical protein
MASSNTLLTPTVIAKEGLMQLLNSLAMGRNVHRDYKNEFVKVGQSVTFRKPNKFRATKAQARSNTNLVEPSTTITMSTQAHVSWAFSSVELTQTIEDYSKRYIAPAAAALANQCDADLTALYSDVYNYAGTPGTTPATFKALGDSQTVLDDEAGPANTRRVGVLNPAANWSLADGLKGTFAQGVAKDIMTRGFLGKIANLDLYMDQNIQRHLTGHYTTGATPLINATLVADASQVVMKGFDSTNNDIHVGDIFTIAGVYAVNPMSGASTGVLRRFVCTERVLSNTTATVKVSPTIVYGATNPYSTVNAYPAENAVVTFIGTEDTYYPQNLMFSEIAFAMVTTPVEMPANVWGARESDADTGLSMRVVKKYDIGADEEIIRLDVIYGVKTLYPELACRLMG